LIDGLDNNERLQGTAGVRVSVDAVAEVKVQTNLYTAELGRTSGGVINILTKSGTNEFHGSVFEFARRGRFDERLYFATVDPERKQDQFGGSIGGPIFRNRTFFFGDYEGYRLEEGQPNLITVPTMAMRNGDFSALLPGTVIYDPTTSRQVGTTTVRDPFPGNIIPQNRIDPIARNLMQLYPAPTTSGLVNNYSGQTNRTQDSNSTDVKVDHRFTQNNTLAMRYSYNDVATFTPGACPTVTISNTTIDPSCVTGGVGGGGAFPGPNDTAVHAFQANYVRIFSPTLVGEIRGGYLKLDIASAGPNEGTNASTVMGLPGANLPSYPGRATGLSAMEVNGYAFLGDQGFLPIEYHDTTKQVNGVLTKTWWSHNIKFGGGLIVRDAAKRGVGGSPSGNYTFNQQLTNSGAGGTGGNSIASLLLGFPSATSRNFEIVVPNYHTVEPSAFVQDDWRATDWLTLNFGVRYDVYTPLTEETDSISNFDVDTLTLLVAGQNGVTRAVNVNTDYSNLAPRFGFSATLPYRMVMRGGWGLTYFPTNMHSPALFRNQPFTSSYPGPLLNLGPTGQVPTVFLSTPLPEPQPSSSTNLAGAIAGVDEDFKAMRINQFNVVLEKEFGGNVVSVGYVGSRTDRAVGTGLGAPAENYNMPKPGPGNVQNRRPFVSTLPAVTNITIRESKYKQWYDSAQFVFQRRYRAGLTLGTHYTWSSGDWTGWAPWDREIVEKFTNPNVIPHKWVLQTTYEIPSGDLTGLAHGFLGGWQVNASAYYQSGLSFDVTNANAQVNNGGGDRPNLVGDPNLPSDDRTLDRWFNTAAFALQAPNTPGNAPRQMMRGPNQRRLDLSFFKNLELGGANRIQFRWEIYNVTNTANFAPPNGAFGNPQFGRISSTGNSIARQMQFAVKYMF
jgi:outer membrane receptor protein involved in Fe transport